MTGRVRYRTTWCWRLRNARVTYRLRRLVGYTRVAAFRFAVRRCWGLYRGRWVP